MLLRFGLVVLTLLLLAKFVQGIEVNSLYTALIVAVMMAVASITIKPILTILTLPIHLITFGISTFFVSAGIFWFLSTFIEGFQVTGIVPALIGSFAVALASSIGSTLK
ncbi:hypothetical protein COB52_05760 [Candidatus Kaiserbacteria bacterium]|nr:MAG: hypothetical protein COB52_05760 [Candidatus Kaiserbacteria bacterium]